MSTQLVVQDRTHAEVSPSGFERAMNCTQSVRLSRRVQRGPSSPDALVGTAAHALLEACLQEGLQTYELGDIKAIVVEGQTVEVNEAMLEGVQQALDYCLFKLTGRPLEFERRVHLRFTDRLGIPLYGFLDVAVPDEPFTVLDYKNGWYEVPPDSIQLRIYLLGLILEEKPELLDRFGGTLAGTTVVVQPNGQGETIKEYDYSVDDMKETRALVESVLLKIRAGEWYYSDGPWCRFCPAAGICPHLAAIATDPAMTAVVPTPEAVASGEITREMLDRWLRKAPQIEQFIKGLYRTAESYLAHGGHLDTLKLVNKQATRFWTKPEAEVVATLKRMGVDPYTKPKLVSPKQAEDRLPSARRKELKALWDKQPGGLTTATMDDKRPAVNVQAVLKAALQQSLAQQTLAAQRPPEEKKS